MSDRKITKTREAKPDLPTSRQLERCMETITTVKAANYFENKVENIFLQSGLKEETKAAGQAVKYFVNQVHLQANRQTPWFENTEIKTDFQVLQKNLGQQAEEILIGELDGPIQFDFALGDEAAFLRAFSHAGEQITDPRLLDLLDKLLNSHLAEQGLISKNSEIFEVNEHGRIVSDKAGNPQHASNDKLKPILSQSFVASMQEKGLTFIAAAHEYPKAAAAEAKAPKPKIPKVKAASTPQIPSEKDRPSTQIKT